MVYRQQYADATLLLQSGEAIQLECHCRGDVAMRHHACAVKWAHVKGDNICGELESGLHCCSCLLSWCQ